MTRPSVRARKAKVQSTNLNARRKQRAASSGASSQQQTYNGVQSRDPRQGVSITLQIPPLRREKKVTDGHAEMRSPVRRLLHPILLLPIVILVAVFVVFGKSDDAGLNGTSGSVSAIERSEPDFLPLTPKAEEASTKRYDSKKNLVSYTTSFSGTRITVSQQALPSNFTKDPKALDKAAVNIGASQRIETDRGPVIVGSDAESGEQLAVYAGENVLLFLHTDTNLDPAAWKSFIELLEARSWEELS